MRKIGLLGGMSWESTLSYYQLLNRMVRERLGGLHSADILLHSVDFAPIAALQAEENWTEAARLMCESATALQTAGAECMLIGTNTMHICADDVQAAISVPLLHIADVTAQAIIRSGCKRPLLLATRFTMEKQFYRGRMSEKHGIDVMVPGDAARGEVHRIIYEELCEGVISPASGQHYLEIVEDARKSGADGVIFGCTEVGLLISQEDLELPAFNSTELHAEAAVDFALGSN